MRRETVSQSGLVWEVDMDRPQGSGMKLFSWDHWIKKMLTKLGIQYNDCCTKATPTGFTVRISANGTKLEKYDPTTGLWVDSGLI